MSDEATTPKLKWVNPKEIKPSGENPRRDDFFKDKDFLRLKESVAQHGVIVPAIVKRLVKETDGKKYTLIDGERRWKAAIDTNVQKIPVYIWPPEKHIDVLEAMFQIHMNQEGWNAIEQARALERIVVALRKKIAKQHPPSKDVEKELVKQLIDKTGMDRSNARSRVLFFRWPKSIREYIYQAEDKDYYSYAVEIESKIVDPALRNFPEIEKTLSAKDIRTSLFEKVKSGCVTRAMDIREASVLAKRRTDTKERGKAKVLLLQFIHEKQFTFVEAKEQYLFLFPEERTKPPFSLSRLLNLVRTITNALEDYTDSFLRKLKRKEKKDLADVLEALTNKTQDLLKRMRK